jgi:predicted phage tail protein
MGPLAGKYPSIKVGATSVADAIEGWSRQVSSQRIPTVMEVPGFETRDLLMAETEVERIELWPAMFGGGSIGRILVGAALIAIAIWNPVIGGMVLSQAGVTAVAAAGIGLMLGGVMSLFMKAPSLSKEQDPEASHYLGTGRNTTQIGTPIAMGGGRMMLGGQIMSLSVNSSDLVYGQFPETTT